ncbi:hypothetical protein N8809_05460 [Euryarchaeota archaeon]|nr:hypothetical protein [Euryarchaeota archaeon]
MGSYNSLYDINSKMIDDYYGKTLRNNYYKSIFILVQSLCPEFEWKFYKFRYLKGHWGEIENQKLWFEDLRDFYGLTTVEDIYSLNLRMITDFYGITLVKEYYGSIPNMVESICPEYEWKFYKFRGSKGDWSDPENQKIWFENFRLENGLDDYESLYKVTGKMIYDNGGSSLHKIYGEHPIHVISSLYPEHDWKPYKFRRAPIGWWSDIKNQKKWFENFRLENGLDDYESLYKVTGKMIYDNGGSSLHRIYGVFPLSVISSLYPEYDWKPYKFSKKPAGWWGNIENQNSWFEDFREHYELNTYETLYDVNNKMVNNFHGSNIMHIYKSIPNLITSLCPDYDWKPYKFGMAPVGWWSDIENQKLWFKDLREHYGFDTYESLYKLTASKIKAFYGSFCLTTIYEGSPGNLVRALIPQFDWKLYKFSNSPQGFWDDWSNIKSWFDDLRSHYGLSTNESLYELSLEMILHYYGRTPVSKLGDSKIELVRRLVPEYDWKEYKFTQTRKDYWDDIGNQKSWFKDFREHYGLDTYESLYDVSSKMISDYYGSGLLTRTKTNYGGSPSLFVPTMCPEYDWDLSKFASNRKTQKSLFKILKQKFPDAIWEYRTEVRWDFRNKIGYDIFVPSMNLAFEGQGHQHYIPIEMWGGSDALTKQKQRDEQKSDLAQELGIRLVIVPFCDLDPELPKWQSSWESLVEICKLQGINLRCALS